jgi:Zn-finger nucleic acid-binding protein
MTSNTDTKCPRCDIALQPQIVTAGTFWKCHGCGGRGVGLAVLRVALTPESINPLWLSAIDTRGQSGSRGCACPSCRNPMIEVPLPGSSELKVDVCRLCQFVWFDIREAGGLIPRPAKEQQQALSEAMGDRGGPVREQLIREMDAKTSAERWRLIAIALHFS